MLNFLKAVFSESGEGSFSRVASAFLCMFACGWVSSIVYHNHKLPDPSELLALGAFVSLFYGINKGTGMKSGGGADIAKQP